MRSIRKNMNMDKKGVFGLQSVKAFFLIILAVALIAYVVIIVMGTLDDANVTTNTHSLNATDSILGNTSEDVSGFFADLSPVYPILAIVVIILVLVVLIRVVGGAGGGGRGTL